ncbi:MAG TPA: nucleotidyltransferase domain-containing protein [Steroidobacteraceae bacterium]|jgi:predicted nucleotidyltransferase|nr:nucleotidyltransferase domain-containing protein [Steroidobacteraceae bacterium]
MATLLARMTAERAGRREAARLEARERLRAALASLLPAGSEVWVFGSVLRPGRFREGSDLDVAVESLPSGLSEAWLQYQLALLTDRSVDVLNLHETGLRARIEREGEKWTL